MKAISTFRRIVPVLAVVALFLLASCASNKKYGCPNKLEVTSILK
jgi:hypothetical protein